MAAGATTTDLITLSALFTVGGLLGYVMRLRGFSAVLGYIIAGIVLGPILHLVDPSSSLLQLMSDLAVTVIAFEIGIRLNFEYIKAELSKLVPIIIFEITIVLGISFGLGSLLKLTYGDVLTLAFTTVNTSTAIAFKLLEEKGMLELSEARNTILGMASMEDIVSLVFLAIFPIVSEGGQPIKVAEQANYIALGLIFATAFGFTFAKRIIDRAMKSGEDMVIIAFLSLVTILTAVSPILRVSPALLALMIGYAVSTIKGNSKVLESVKPLREFFLVIFFVAAGATVPALAPNITLVLVATLATAMVFIKVAAFTISAWITGINPVTSVKLGLYMAPISEFGIIIASIGLSDGVTTYPVYIAVILVVGLSSMIASIITKYDNSIAPRIANILPQLSIFKSVKGRDREQVAIRIVRRFLTFASILILALYLGLVLDYLLYIYNFAYIGLTSEFIYLFDLVLPVYFIIYAPKYIRELYHDFNLRLTKYISAYLSILLYVVFIGLSSLLSAAVADTVAGIGGTKPVLGSLTYIISLILSVVVIFLGVRRLERAMEEGEVPSISQ